MEELVSPDGRVRIRFEGGTAAEKAEIMASVIAEVGIESELGGIEATLRRGESAWRIHKAQRHLPGTDRGVPEDPHPTAGIIDYKTELLAILTHAGIGAQASPD